MEHNLHFPNKNFYAPGQGVTVDSRVSILDRGMDPKPIVLEYCKPLCVYWKEKLERCEMKLQTIIKVNPTKTCLYPMRDYVTCVEACVSRLLPTYLLGATQGAQQPGGVRTRPKPHPYVNPISI